MTATATATAPATAVTTSTAAATTARRRRALALACSVLVAGPVGACSGGDGPTGGPAGLSAPRGARDTAAFVDDALAGEHGEPDDATVRLYAEVTADRLPDFADDDVTDDPPHASADGDTVVIGSVPASRFVALALATDDGRQRVAEAHRAAALDLAVAGLAADGPGSGAEPGAGPDSDWRSRLGKLDAIVAAARAGDDPAGDANLVVADAQDAEERTIVAAYLVTALRSEAEGTLGPTGRAIVGVAEATMPAAVLAEVRTRVSEAGSAEEAVADLAPDLDPGAGTGAGRRRSLAGALDRLREGFAGHEEYPVEATMFAVFDAHARHFRAATAHPPGG